MRLGVVKDLLGRAVAHKFLKHLALTMILCSGGQLAVGERACAALAELDV